jgi:pantetheine-phosphate adenylyltransferase
LNKRTAIYPGSFDPLTNGHLDIITRALDIFDEVTVAVLVNKSKSPAFSAPERVKLIKKCVTDLKGVSVESYDGLLVNYLRKKNCNTVLRGLRAATDLEYEFQMSIVNNMMDPGIETVFLMTARDNVFLTSSLVREAYACGGQLPACVPQSVAEALLKKFKK